MLAAYARAKPMASEAICKGGGIMRSASRNFVDVLPHFSLVPPHKGAERLFVTDVDTIEVSHCVGSAVCISTLVCMLFSINY